MQLTEYRTLGRSGLCVSPLCLGTMTFGTEWGWGSEENVASALFDRYLEAGGNFMDTADGYTGGTSEEMDGKFIADRNLQAMIHGGTTVRGSDAPRAAAPGSATRETEMIGTEK